MAITISTTRWEEVHGRRPGGVYSWKFSCAHPEKGSYLMCTDGPYPRARDRALASFRDHFGARATLEGELLP